MNPLRRVLVGVLPLLVACGAGVGGVDGAGQAQSALDTVNSPVILNEVLANEPGSATSGEFVELVNTGSQAVDLGGWTISDSSSVRHTFAQGTTLGAGQAIVVFGSASGIPAGLSNAVGASSGALGLGNGGDTVTVKDAAGALMGQLGYTSSLSGTDGVSMNRDTDGVAGGSWVLHTTLSSRSSSPGTRVDGSAFSSTGSTDAGSGGGTGTPHVFLNEVLANEPGSATSGEFVELVNDGSGAADLSGWTISDSSMVRHTFDSGTSLGAGQAIVVFGGASGIPSGLSNAVAASSGSLGLNNGGDTVTLADGAGSTVDQVGYTSALSGQDGVSMNRDPDGDASGTWVLHTTLSSLSRSPGTRADGSAFDGSVTDGGTSDGGTSDGGTDGGVSDGGTDGGSGGGTSDGGVTRVRLMAGNLTSGNYQSYDPGEGIRIFEGLNPDIAMIQEFNYGSNSPSDIRSFVDQAFGTNFSVCQPHPEMQIPNGVVSDYPIRTCGAWTDSSVSNRMFVYARIDVPGPHDLWAISVHLLTKGASYRSTEMTQLHGYIQQNVPAGDFVVIGGDYNTHSDTEGCVVELASDFATTGPFPVDNNGDETTNGPRSEHEDWVMVTNNLHAYETSVEIGSDVFSHGLVFDSRVYQPLSEVSPVQYGDSAATNMQHMGVVKDFLLPN